MKFIKMTMEEHKALGMALKAVSACTLPALNSAPKASKQVRQILRLENLMTEIRSHFECVMFRDYPDTPSDEGFEVYFK